MGPAGFKPKSKKNKIFQNLQNPNSIQFHPIPAGFKPKSKKSKFSKIFKIPIPSNFTQFQLDSSPNQKNQNFPNSSKPQFHPISHNSSWIQAQIKKIKIFQTLQNPNSIQFHTIPVGFKPKSKKSKFS